MSMQTPAMITQTSDKLNHSVMRALSLIEWLGLLFIIAATVVAFGQHVNGMLHSGLVVLPDILLMFIFLEILTMAGLYFRSGKLPVRYPLYIAMVSIARHIIIDMKSLDAWTMISLAASILVLALGVIAIRWGHIKLPYDERQ
jgi:protein PsiE